MTRAGAGFLRRRNDLLQDTGRGCGPVEGRISCAPHAHRRTSSTIGLVGAWGSGKSRALNKLITRLKQPDEVTTDTMKRQWRVAEFNPWLSSGPTALYSSFFRALRDSLPEDEQWNETKENLLKVGRRLAPLSALTGLFGVDTQEAVEKTLDALTDDDDPLVSLCHGD